MIKISTQWTDFERRHVISLLERRLTKPVTGDDIELILRKIDFLKNNSATSLEADAVWLLDGLNVERT